jgi:branched-chain amino acid transport system permease protein
MALGLVTLALVWLPLQSTGSVGATADFLAPFLSTVAIFAVITIGLNVQWGYTGVFNFGIVAFFMVGAYTAAIVTKAPADTQYVQYVGGFGPALSFPSALGGGQWMPFLLGVLAAAAVSAGLGLLLALPTLRLRDDYLAITTIGVAEILRRITIEERWLVNGTRGLTGVPRPLDGWLDADTHRYVYLLITLVALAGVYVLVERALRSPWGRVLRAIREDEAAVAASGKDVFHFRMQGFVLGAAIMGVGGALYAYQVGTVSPETFTHFFGTFIFWAMLIAGGSGNTAGAIVGAYLIWGFWSITLQLQSYGQFLPDALQPLLQAMESRIFFVRDFLVGALIVLVLLVRPRGLLPEEARVSRWLEARVRAMRRAESEAPPAN